MSRIEDLTLEPPRSPKLRIRGYAILARTLDKCRATLAGKEGDYHYDCPVDRLLFGFKQVQAEELKERVKAGDSDTDISIWLDKHGNVMSSEKVEAWSEEMEGQKPFDDPDMKEWFAGECNKLGLRPEVTTLFDYLDADDAASF